MTDVEKRAKKAAYDRRRRAEQLQVCRARRYHSKRALALGTDETLRWNQDPKFLRLVDPHYYNGIRTPFPQSSLNGNPYLLRRASSNQTAE